MEQNSKTPWHLWVVAILALLWNGFGAMDYIMTQTRNAEYMSAFTPEQLKFFYSLPTWVNATWAIGIWGAVLGSLLLLFRSRYSTLAFRFSLLGLVLTATHNFVLADVSLAKVTDNTALIFTAVLFLIALMLLWYAKLMQAKGLLR